MFEIEPEPVIIASTPRKPRDKTAYLTQPPAIKPNYGKKKKSLMPATNLSKIILYDNAMQDLMLDVEHKYVDTQRRRARLQFHKTRYALVDLLRTRKSRHENWDAGYQKMKDAFIAMYGPDSFTPPEEEIVEEEPPPIDPFLLHARIAPPINILCFFLEAKQKEEQHKKDIAALKLRLKNKKSKKRKDIAEFMYDYDRLLRERKCTTDGEHENSKDDQRFRDLEETLVPPTYKTDGYMQLSPTYCKQPYVPLKKPVPHLRYRELTLPPFYQKARAAVHEGDRSDSSADRKSVDKDSTFPPPPDDHADTMSSLSDVFETVALPNKDQAS